MLISALSSGDPDRVWSGTDYLGNVCGKSGQERAPIAPYKPWNTLQELFLPAKVEIVEGKVTEVSMGDALVIGVCVESCPQAGDMVLGYNGKVKHQSMFDHVLVMGRCIPIFDLYDVCEYNHCLSNATNDFNMVFDAGTFFFRGVASLESFKWVVVVCLILAFVLTLLWLVLLKNRSIVKPFAVVSVVVLQILLIVAAVLMWIYADSVQERTFKVAYKLCSVGFMLLFVAFVTTALYLYKKFSSAVSVVQVASCTQVAMPSLSLITPVSLLLMLPFVVFAFIMATYIQTSGLAFEEATSSPDTEIPALWNSSGMPSDAEEPTEAPEVEGHNVFEPPKWKFPAHIFNIALFLWTAAFLRHLAYTVISMGCSSWYWSAPSGKVKVVPYGVMFRCLGRTLRYHLGTAALGSALTLVFFFLGLLVRPVEVLLKLQKKRCLNPLDCTHSALSIAAHVTELVSSASYIMVSMCGDGYWGGAYRAFFLIKSNIFHVGSIRFVSSCTIFFGKISLTGIVVFVGWLLLKYAGLATYKSPEGKTDSTALVVPLFVIGFFSWIVISVFSAGMQICIETVLLCFCYDVHINNGSDEEPVYMPTNLKDLMKQQLSWHLTHEAHLLHVRNDFSGATRSKANLNVNLAASEFFAASPEGGFELEYVADSDSSEGVEREALPVQRGGASEVGFAYLAGGGGGGGGDSSGGGGVSRTFSQVSWLDPLTQSLLLSNDASSSTAAFLGGAPTPSKTPRLSGHNSSQPGTGFL